MSIGHVSASGANEDKGPHKDPGKRLKRVPGNAPIPPAVTASITAAAYKLINKGPFKCEEFQDLKQQITLEFLIRRRRVSAERAADRGFIITTITHIVADLARARKRRQPDIKRTFLYHQKEPTRDAHPKPVRKQLTNEQDARRTHRHVPGDMHRCLRLDMHFAMSTLPPRLQKIVQHFAAADGSSRLAARKLGMHHSTVRRSILLVREHLKKRGLESYFSTTRKKPRSPAPRSNRPVTADQFFWP
jgi:DNA-directed RNA polymerase specialized sigma24 family protein